MSVDTRADGDTTTRLGNLVDEVAAVAGEHAEETDRDAVFPAAATAAMRRTGLLGLLVPREHGGLGGGLTDLVEVTCALGRVDMSTAMIFAMHCQQVAAVDRCADDPLRARVLPGVAQGRTYIASVTTEPGTGGHLLTSESETGLAAGELLVDRMAPVVTGGRHADGFLITVLAPDATSPTQVSLVYAERSQLQLEVVGGWQPLGMRATESIPMRITGRVPASQVVGRPGQFRAVAAEIFAPLAHVGWAAAWLGTAAGAYSRVLGHLRSSGGRDRPTSELQLARVADVRARLEVVHALLQRAVQLLTADTDVTGTPAQLLLNTLKIRAAEECFAAVDELVELVGLRLGYLPSPALGLERSFRDLRSASLNYGNDRLRLSNGPLALMDTGVHLA